ncbi:hypothetical protein TSH100_10680 [Azospirillum sp. TSH100]|uniref:hypothetical protein n=1 Tax=Azospirillum sp. TSH100 TaxID=652764 RepID=UPI000D60F61A|nr:hypothetical protein [Azospirillum sp. TSH100]PWC87246.1 hypothetical protein TSH100_10680 [Azospirillum sp. TSH100]QCG89971.1 hypothetical protein E6C72_19505 [Azospirillum sp. TSH100]
MGSGYSGWELPAEERERLLAQVPPRYGRLVAHHVTLAFGAGPDEPLPSATEAEVIGCADDGEGVQALVVAIDGTSDRPDGSTYHITWSLADGRQPAESNDVIRDYGWRPVEPTTVRLVPRYFGG